jgi:hypothetical protein
MKLKVQDMTTEILSVARVQNMNWNNVGLFFNMPEHVVTDHNFCGTPGNIFKH